MARFMETHGRAELMFGLKVCECDQSSLQRGADRLTSIARPELSEQVVQVSLDRRCGDAELVSHSLGGVSLCDLAKYLHLPRRKRDGVALG